MCVENNITNYIKNYKSWHNKWNQCHQEFIQYLNNSDNETSIKIKLTSSLKDYMGSFGMRRAGFLRGNSCEEKLSCVLENLKKTNNKFLIDLDYANTYSVKCQAPSILTLSYDLKCELIRNFGNRNNLDIPNISAVFITKILMATYCCTPGFDSKLQSALRKRQMSDKFNEESLIKLSEFYVNHLNQFNRVNQDIPSARKLDMHLWTEG